MDPMSAAMLAGGIGQALGTGVTIIGGLLSKGDRDKAAVLYNQALDQLQKQGVPPNLAQQVILNEFKQQGTLTPQMEQDLGEIHSKLEQFKEDKSLREAQVSALSKMRSLGEAGGLDFQARQKLQEALQEEASQNQAAQAQIQQQLAQRGQAGSGAEIMARLAAQQGSANRASRLGLGVASEAEQRALQATKEAQSMADRLRSQDLGVASELARAQDVMAQFNRQNAAARQMRNVASGNEAQRFNLGLAQDIANRNIQQANVEKLRQNEAQRQYWQDISKYNQMQAEALKGRGDIASGQAEATQKTFGQIGAGISSMGGSLAGMAAKGSGGAGRLQAPVEPPIELPEGPSGEGESFNISNRPISVLKPF